jgi:uncharacterized protein
MNVWAISDLHLSFARPDGRERYAARWRDHAAQIERNWKAAVAPGDLVLVPGDISMARNHRDLQPDFEWLARLPGTKVLSRGNHDQWWNDLEAIRRLLRPSLLAVDGDALATHGVIVCGAAGSPVPTGDLPTAKELSDASIATAALGAALGAAAALRARSDTMVFVLWHYPPFDANGRPGPCVELLERAGATACVYGHVHIQGQWPHTVHGTVRGVRYHCVAADSIAFRPLRIKPANTGISPSKAP